MRHGKALLVLGSMAALAGLNAEAAPFELAAYNFDDGLPAATASSPVITAEDVQLGAFLNDNGDGDGGPGFAASGAFVRNEDTANPVALGGTIVSLADAITSGDYFSFKIKYIATTFSISQVTFDYNISAGSNETDFAAHLFSSVGGFVDGAELSSTAVTATGVVQTPVIVPLSLTSLANDVEFRIYLRDNQGGTIGNGQVHRLDNIVVTGVPEPGSLALLGMGSLCFLYRRRRRA